MALLEILVGRPFCWNVYKDDDDDDGILVHYFFLLLYIIYFKHQLGTYITHAESAFFAYKQTKLAGLLSNSYVPSWSSMESTCFCQRQPTISEPNLFWGPNKVNWMYNNNNSNNNNKRPVVRSIAEFPRQPHFDDGREWNQCQMFRSTWSMRARGGWADSREIGVNNSDGRTCQNPTDCRNAGWKERNQLAWVSQLYCPFVVR